MGCIKSCAEQNHAFFLKEAHGVFETAKAFVVEWDPKPRDFEMPMEYYLEHSKCRKSSFLRSRYQVCGAKHGIETKAVNVSIDPWTGRLESPLRFTIVPEDGEKA